MAAQPRSLIGGVRQLPGGSRSCQATIVETDQAAAIAVWGNLVQLRDAFWMVESVIVSEVPPDSADQAVCHLVGPAVIDDSGSSDSLTVLLEIELGTERAPRLLGL